MVTCKWWIFRDSEFMYWGLQPVHSILSNKVGRKILIFPGMFVQNIGIYIIYYIKRIQWLVISNVLLGIGTALVYST